MQAGSPVFLKQEMSPVEVRTYYIRHRHALLARCDFGDVYRDMILHHAEWGLVYEAEPARILRDAVAALALHGATRPQPEITAWTVHFEHPLLNVFVTMSNPTGDLVGTLFCEDIPQRGENLFFAEIRAPEKPPRKSVVGFSCGDFFPAVERYFAQSEQRLTRLFRFAPEDIVLVQAQPDADEEWIHSLDDELIRSLDQREQLSLLEKRAVQWNCGCSQARMMDVLLPTMRTAPDELFGGKASLRMQCPRCGARHLITREALEAHLDGHQ